MISNNPVFRILIKIYENDKNKTFFQTKEGRDSFQSQLEQKLSITKYIYQFEKEQNFAQVFIIGYIKLQDKKRVRQLEALLDTHFPGIQVAPATNEQDSIIYC